MSANLENFTLESYIKDKKKASRRGVQRTGVRKTTRREGGPQSRFGTRGRGGLKSRGRGGAPRQHFREERERRAPRPQVNRRKLRVSNLPLKVTNDEIYELFSQFGPLSLCKIQYDKLGRSYGTATVEFNEESSARDAKRDYNGAELDGKTIRIEYSDTGAGSASISKRISRNANDRPVRSERPRRFEDSRPSGRGFRGGFKRRFNDRVREQRSYRSRR